MTVDDPFWEAARQMRLVVQTCQQCGAAWWPPVERCGGCDGGLLVWTEVPPRGRVWSYAIYHRIFDPRLQLSTPYAIAAVELDAGACLPGRIVGSLEGLAVGAAVEASFTELEETLIGPVWRLTGEESGEVGSRGRKQLNAGRGSPP